jgi:hypothetical protein
MKKTKTKELLKVAVVAILSVGLFCAALLGVNHLAFTAAVNRTEAMGLYNEAPMSAMPWNTMQISEIYGEPEGYDFGHTPFRVITHMHPDSPTFVIPKSALPMEDAATIGAEYIWDALGVSVQGMHVFMIYSDLPGYVRPYWIGNVYMENAARKLLNGEENTYSPMATFSIDAGTGKRVNVSFTAILNEQTYRLMEEWGEENIMSWRRDMLPIMAMDDSEMMAHLGFSVEQLGYYMEKAIDYAQGHFNETTVMNAILGQIVTDARGTPMFLSGITPHPVVDENGTLSFVVGSLTFTVTDHTGREALVLMTTGQITHVQMVSITTQNNDIIPGFVFDHPGLG